MKSQEEIKAGLKEILQKNENIIAVWEGGSVATGFDDEYSDLDLAVVCEDDAVEEIFTLIDGHLGSEYGIENKFRLPEPAWHGFSQCYYKTGNVPEFFYFDIAVIKRSNPNKFTERDRHGDSFVWFEKEKMIDPTPTPDKEVKAKGKKFYHMATDTFFLSEIELKKAIARNNYTESFHQYYIIILRTLGILLNLKYRPCKVDFGLRYAYRDYPESENKLLEDSLKVNSVNEIAERSGKVLTRINDLKKELFIEWN